ncbi:M10 family metallopeptidase C-terminal domain-containing protein [Microvirga lenta]|uniref:M10 family metallopeptidase C-terminal domain-containing protein n=1 Tax=Microvirga lenta TaxID=2881337 RepID=UPI001CFF8EB0|nr:M10 family metallopeptidase C-terminal domain-containing protein [Microvirga lenta]MCB5177600.1 M10 family metallopeptidase C-terminal domain-containing protein [Microvirga lenta]
MTNKAFWSLDGQTAQKWGAPFAGTGAVITYTFDPASQLTKVEKNTFLKAFAMWSAVADIKFVESGTNADVRIQRGNDGGAWENGPVSNGSGYQLGSHTGQATISMDTAENGFDLSGSFDKYGGYGMGTAIHEVGHLLGLGHGGPYNGNVDASTQQFSAYDNRMWTIMSYIGWTAADAKYAGSYPVTGTNWGVTQEGIPQNSPHTIMMLDIMAIQQLYGAAKNGPFSGGQVFGFNSNVKGLLRQFFDFTINKNPVVTLYSQGKGNTLDLSGFSEDSTVNLKAGTFSSAAGETNNIAIASGTIVEKAVTGSGDDILKGNSVDNVLKSGGGADILSGFGGNDVLRGGAGQDTFVFKTKLNSRTNVDRVADFRSEDDAFHLDNLVFKKLGKGSSANPIKLEERFFSLNKARDKDDYLIYNKKQGALYYDADGSGRGDAIKFATVKKNLDVTAENFFIV